MTLPLLGLVITAVAALFGVVIGSFLNVVIYRLPTWLHHQWQNDAAHILGTAPHAQPVPSLAYPASHCPHCKHPLRWWQNIPLLSFAVLRGRCHHCQHTISWRYPVVELICGLWFAWCFHHDAGLWPQALFWALWGAALLALAAIDARHFLLPDVITQPMLWAGLLAATLGVLPVEPTAAIWGAVLGYTVLWGPAWLFEKAMGKIGMAPGDFKLMAAVGAALGWVQVIPVLLLSCGVGIALAIIGRYWPSKPMEHSGLEAGAIPFGTAIAIAAAATLVWPQWIQVLQWGT